MMRWNVIHKIKSLHDDGKGLSIRAISRELGISRNSVRKYLRQDETTTARKLDNPALLQIVGGDKLIIPFC